MEHQLLMSAAPGAAGPTSTASSEAAQQETGAGPVAPAPGAGAPDERAEGMDAQPAAAAAEPCELDKPEYKMDEFRLYQFKIKQCTNEEAHDWCLCPFAHPGEKAQRRDPRLFKYTGISCPDYRKGTCKRGNACPYAHGVFEVWLHPSRYRTQPCKDAPHCTRQVCFFAHTLEEVRHVEPADLPALEEAAALAATTDTDGSESDATVAEPLPPRCGSNTNAKAAAAKAAKAATAAPAAGGPQAAADGWAAAPALKRGGGMLSRQASTCSSASGLAGLEPLGSLSSALGTPALSLLSHAASLGAGGPPSLLAAHGAGGLLGAGAGGRLLQVPADIALEANALRVAAGLPPVATCDTFGSLDAASMAAAAAAAAAAVGVSGQAHHHHAPLDAPAFGGACAAAAAAAPWPPAGAFGGAAPPPHAAAGLPGPLDHVLAMHRAVAAQHAEINDMVQAVLLRQHHDAMWSAAYRAAADVGLCPATAAACADAAVQSAAAAAGGACQQPPASSPGAAGPAPLQFLAMQQQQQQQCGLPPATMGLVAGGGLAHAAQLAMGSPPLPGLAPPPHQHGPLMGLPAPQPVGLLMTGDPFAASKLGQGLGLGAFAPAPLQVPVTAGAGAFGLLP